MCDIIKWGTTSPQSSMYFRGFAERECLQLSSHVINANCLLPVIMMHLISFNVEYPSSADIIIPIQAAWIGVYQIANKLNIFD